MPSKTANANRAAARRRVEAIARAPKGSSVLKKRLKVGGDLLRAFPVRAVSGLWIDRESGTADRTDETVLIFSGK